MNREKMKRGICADKSRFVHATPLHTLATGDGEEKNGAGDAIPRPPAR
jgi:hypothetical protein